MVKFLFLQTLTQSFSLVWSIMSPAKSPKKLYIYKAAQEPNLVAHVYFLTDMPGLYR